MLFNCRLSQPLSCRTTNSSFNSKTNLSKDKNYRYEVTTTTKKCLAETNETIRKLKSNSLQDSHSCRVIKKKSVSDNDNQLCRMTCHVEDLQQVNKKLENKPQVK